MSDTGSVFKSLRTQSLASRIVGQVIDALFSGRLEPGEFLGTEAQLTEIFQTSRVPIREALGRLEALGVVEIKTGAGGGATIAEGNPDRVALSMAVQFMLVKTTPEEIFDVRIGIECRAVEMAAERITDEEIEELRDRLRRIEEAGLDRSQAAMQILGFHRAIVDAAHSRTLSVLMHALEHALRNLFMTIDAEPTGWQSGYRRLNGIMDKIAERDAEGASAAMREHLLGRRKSTIYRLKQKSSDKDGVQPFSAEGE